MKLSVDQILSIEKELIEILKEAGSRLLFYWGKCIKHGNKDDQSFVTEADLAIEDFLINSLSKLYPNATFLAEESGYTGKNDGPYQWVIDPLDGTRNFTHHIPYFCISVALTYKDDPLIGVIYNPLHNELFYASKGNGSFYNGKKISIKAPQSFEQSFLVFGISHLRDRRSTIVKASIHLASRVAAIRCMGAVALDMAYIALGRFDGALFASLAWWDVAAGILIIQESGGVVFDWEGEKLTPSYANCMAGSALICNNLLQYFIQQPRD